MREKELENNINQLINQYSKLIAFTLAEVLIVLGIIGIVAEMTIPTLVHDFQTQVTVTSLKKVYTVLSQVDNLAVQENGTPDNWVSVSNDAAQNALAIENIFAPYLKVLKTCNSDTTCIPAWTYLEGGSWAPTDGAALYLTDGTIVIFRYWGDTNAGATTALSHVVAPIHVDINGLKKPNVIGKDIFRFILTRDGGILPSGTNGDTSGSFDDLCINKSSLNTSGQGCTAWAMYNENMDYLKPCKMSLSWNGPTKCQ